MIGDDINYDKLPDKKILCVDMKSFYASIEAVDRGYDPWEIPLAVIGNKQRKGGVVLAATPAMKEKFQIGTANRVYQIPEDSEIIIVEARMELYLQVSLEITRLFNEFAPLNDIHVYSVDESWLKLDNSLRSDVNSWQMAKKIKREMLDRFCLPSSMALGPNMFLAKVAMDVEGKKRGLVSWKYEDVPQKLWPLSLTDCWGIGARMAKHFNKMGVKTVGDLAHLPLAYLENKFGIIGNQLYYHAWGVDLSQVEGHYKDKKESIGRGITLYRDYTKLDEIKTVIFELSEVVAQRARKNNVAGKTISLGISYSRDEIKNGFNRQKTISQHTNLTSEIYKICLELLQENYQGARVRKIRVNISNLVSDENIQLNLFTSRSKKLCISKLKDTLQTKFNHKALFYARSLKNESIRERINTTIGGHKKY